ncbi:MAG: hypothetical protein K2J00_06755 [Bacteroidaceae bacterium]|nr:hypothetical protein [Bacteroidaceae bacterium]
MKNPNRNATTPCKEDDCGKPVESDSNTKHLTSEQMKANFVDFTDRNTMKIQKKLNRRSRQNISIEKRLHISIVTDRIWPVPSMQKLIFDGKSEKDVPDYAEFQCSEHLTPFSPPTHLTVLQNVTTHNHDTQVGHHAVL